MPRPDREPLNKAPRILRSTIARGLAKGTEASAVEDQAGDFGAGLIRGMAIITRGEALGHGLWCDAVLLEQVSSAINGAPNGIKARFTHPELSGDGLGKGLGRVKNAPVEGDTVRGDLHVSQAAHQTPDGDLAGYVLALAKEDPESFGNSIAFDPDYQAETDFLLAHGAEWAEDDLGRYLDLANWKSPDADNVNNLPHARLKQLRAVDAVDDPAANPTGLFHRGQEIARDAEQLLAWTLGLSAERPQLVSLDIDPDRIGGFIQRFFNRHKLTLTTKDGAPMPIGKGLDKFTSGLAAMFQKTFAAPQQSRDEKKEAAGQEEGDADKDEGKDAGVDEGQGDFDSSGVDGGGHANGGDKMAVKCDTGNVDGEDDKKNEAGEFDDDSDDDTEEMGAATKGRQLAAGHQLAEGGEDPVKGGESDDEAAIQKKKQDKAKQVADGSKADAKQESAVGTPGSEKGAVGPMGDPSSLVGYSAARQECKRFTTAFGPQGATWFAEGKTFAEASALHVKALERKNAALENENQQLKGQAQDRRGLARPLNVGGQGTSVSPEQQRLHNNAGGGGMAAFALGISEMLQRRNLN